MGLIAKDDILFADLLYKAVEEKNLEAGDMVKKALQAFIMKPKTNLVKKIQAVGVSTDIPKNLTESFNVTLETDNFDLGYEQAFRTVPLGANQDSWEIFDVSNALTFQKVEEGQRIEVAGISGSKATAYVDYYGGAIGWTDKMIRFRKVAAMTDLAMVFRNKFWANKADNHYTLLAAAAASNITAYQGAVADGQIRRDIETINKAAFDLGNRCKDKGFGDMANAPMIIYANPYDESRIEAAFKAMTGDLSTALGKAGQITSRRITRIYTYNSNILAGAPVIVLPFQKIQKADAMAPTTYTMAKDPLTLNECQAVWAIYGAIVGDTDQTGRITLS
jgi:hypothetical protein